MGRPTDSDEILSPPNYGRQTGWAKLITALAAAETQVPCNARVSAVCVAAWMELGADG